MREEKRLKVVEGEVLPPRKGGATLEITASGEEAAELALREAGLLPSVPEGVSAERFEVALDLLSIGKGLDVAAGAIGMEARELRRALSESVELRKEIRQRAYMLRDLVYIGSMSEMLRRLNGDGKKPSDRDLAEWARASAPQETGGVQVVRKVKLDL